MRWFAAHLPATGVTLRNLSNDWGGIAIFGPKSREALARVTAEDVSHAAFPFMTARMMDVGLCNALVARISVTGELGYEIHAPQVYLGGIYDRLMAAARDLKIVDVGMYALLSLRMEKGFGIWTREFSRDYTPAECGLARFVAYDKPAFIGREAALKDRDTAPERQLVLLDVDAADADASFYEPIWSGDERVGFVTSAAYGHTCGKSLAYGLCFELDGQARYLTRGDDRWRSSFMPGPRLSPRLIPWERGCALDPARRATRNQRNVRKQSSRSPCPSEWARGPPQGAGLAPGGPGLHHPRDSDVRVPVARRA